MADPCWTAPFSAAEYGRRLAAVQRAIADRRWRAAMVVDPTNIYYLTGLNRVGYFSFTCVVIPLHRPPVLVARAMEEPTVALQAPDVGFVGYGDGGSPTAAVVRALDAAGVSSGTVGAEIGGMYLPPRVYEELRTAIPTLTWADGSGLVEAVSRVKSAGELEHIERAARLSDLAADRAIASVGVGVSEAEVAGNAYHALVSSGGDHPAFPPLVRTTRRVSYEHLTWSTETLHPGDGLVLELSGCVHRYHAPLTRTTYSDGISSGDREAAELALEGLEAVRDALRPGARSGEAYAAWQAVMDHALGVGRYRRHNCGHLVGCGFFPGWFGGAHMAGLTPDSAIELHEGMTVHIFSWVSGPRCPGNYVLSDTVLVTATGAEFLTHTKRKPPA